ncbi:MAG: HD domain-containing protein [Methanosarcinaceae archaeon]|nr:HD domain-containing protein [Methanosarcinaceae archaeon]
MIIHDPVHKTVILSKLEQMLVNTRQVQRLRKIQQLGLADVVYPGANHTRFEHSIGTMHTASIIANSLGLEPEEVQKVRIAGLLHDVGHSALSHAVEGVLKRNTKFQPRIEGKKVVKHESFTKNIINNIFSNETNICQHVESEFGVDTHIFFDEIAKMATGDAHSLDRPYLGHIISGDIDADRIDFLLRDSYHTGVSLGLIDVDQIVQSLMIKDNRIVLGASEGSSYGEDMALTAAESMLIARAHHYTAIIHHPKTQAARVMLLYALEDALSNVEENGGKNAVTAAMIKFFTVYNDNDLLGFIKTNGSPNAKKFMTNIRDGKIYDPCVRFTQKTLPPVTKMALSTIARHGVAIKMFETELTKGLDDVLIDLSVASGVPKNTRVAIKDDECFFYDESVLANGLVRAISRQMSLTAFAHPDAVVDAVEMESKMRVLVDDISPKLIRFIRGEQYLPIEGLLLLIYGVHNIFEEKDSIYISIPKIRNITWLYNTVELFSKDEILKNLFDYSFHKRYGFPYSERLFEDLQILVAMGIVDEDLRYYESNERFKQRYEYVLTSDGVEYASSLKDSYGREFSAIMEYLGMNKHSIPRDIVKIQVNRYSRK